MMTSGRAGVERKWRGEMNILIMHTCRGSLEGWWEKCMKADRNKRLLPLHYRRYRCLLLRALSSRAVSWVISPTASLSIEQLSFIYCYSRRLRWCQRSKGRLLFIGHNRATMQSNRRVLNFAPIQGENMAQIRWRAEDGIMMQRYEHDTRLTTTTRRRWRRRFWWWWSWALFINMHNWFN